MNQKENNKKPETITIAGVTFSADQVKAVTISVGDREIHICDQEQENSQSNQIGFNQENTKQ